MARSGPPGRATVELVQRHWSGKHHAVVEGINLITVLWSDGDRHVPVDYRIYDKAGDALTKNDHFRTMLAVAHGRGFMPECVVFDSWYSSLDNLKQVRDLGWTWLTRLKANRLVNPDRTGLRPVASVETAAQGKIVHLKGYGPIRLFLIVAPDGDKAYWATNDGTVEHYHRGIKQYCGVERAQVRAARAQRNHIGLALRAFLRLERHCYHVGISWFEAKTTIIRSAVQAYLTNPLYTLPVTA